MLSVLLILSNAGVAAGDDYVCTGDPSPGAHLQRSDVVVWGMLTAAERIETWGRDEGQYRVELPALGIGMDLGWKVTFRVDRVWKGEPSDYINVELGRQEWQLTVGRHWLLFLDLDARGNLVADPCSPYRETELEDAVADLGPHVTNREADRLESYRERLLEGEAPIVVGGGAYPPQERAQ